MSVMCMKEVGVLPSHAKPPRNAGKASRLEKKKIYIYIYIYM